MQTTTTHTTHKSVRIEVPCVEGWLYKSGTGLSKRKLKKRYFKCIAGTQRISYATTQSGKVPVGMASVSTKKGVIELATATKLVEGFYGQFWCVVRSCGGGSSPIGSSHSLFPSLRSLCPRSIVTPDRSWDLHIERPTKASDPHYAELMYKLSKEWLAFLANETGLAVSGEASSPNGFTKVSRRESITLLKMAGGVLPGGTGAAAAAAAAAAKRNSSLEKLDLIVEDGTAADEAETEAVEAEPLPEAAAAAAAVDGGGVASPPAAPGGALGEGAP